MACAIALVGAEAQAGNAAAPRVPPSFLGAQCVQTVRRDEDPVLALPIGIPFEDTGLTADELPDGRRFQFFASCRPVGPGEELPPWISAEDVARASALDPAVGDPGPEAILESAAAFTGPGHDGEAGTCIVPITGAGERLPITCEATSVPVSWDTTSVPPGAYEIWGYTFAPAQNLWTPRPGVVRIVDGPEADAGPAVAFAWPLAAVTAGLDAGVVMRGCVAASPGTRLEIAYATADALAEESDPWVPWVELQEDDGAFEVAWVPPPELVYEAVFVRAIATDPAGRRFAASTRAPIVFVPGCDPPEGGTRAVVDACGVAAPGDLDPAAFAGGVAARKCDRGDAGDPATEPEAPGPGDTGGEADADDADGHEGEPDASGCRTGRGRPDRATWWLGPGLAVAFSRRRAAPTCGRATARRAPRPRAGRLGCRG